MATPSPEDIEMFRSMNEGGPQGSRIPLILGFEITMIVLVVGVVSLRFYARTVIKRALGWDDWFMFASTVVAFTNTIVSCVSTRYGMGLHAWNPVVNDNNAREASKLGWVYSVLFTPAVTLSKVSILLTYLRIFPARNDRLFCFCLLVYLIVYGVIVTVIVALQSRERVLGHVYSGHKVYEPGAMMTTSVLNSLSDLLVFLWPAPKLWDVALPKRQRVGLVLVFSLGCVVCIAGIIRIAYYPTFFGSKDVFWEAAITTVASAVECDLAVICGSLPEIRPLMVRLFKQPPVDSGPEYFFDARDSFGPDSEFHRFSSLVKLPEGEEDSSNRSFAMKTMNVTAEYGSNASTSNSSREKVAHGAQQRQRDETCDIEAPDVHSEEVPVVLRKDDSTLLRP